MPAGVLRALSRISITQDISATVAQGRISSFEGSDNQTMRFCRRQRISVQNLLPAAALMFCCGIAVLSTDAQTAPADPQPATGPQQGMVSVKSAVCGPATGDGKTDDTAAINACLNYAKEHNVSVYFPSGTYRVTSPLNCTVSRYPRGGLWLVGDARGRPTTGMPDSNSTILDELTVPGPVIDCGGDTQGGIMNLAITTRSTHYQGTSSTSGILVSEGPTGNVEGGQLFQILHVSIIGTGDCSGCAAIAMPGVDEEVLNDIVTNAGSIVLGWGLGRSTRVNSTFYSLESFLPNTNTCQVTIQNAHLGGDFVPAVQLTGSDDYDLFKVYAAVGGTARSAIEITTPSGIPGVAGNAIHFYGVRTEVQSLANNAGRCESDPSQMGCSVAAIMFGSRSVEGVIDGQICTDSAGSQIATEGNGGAIESQRWTLGCANTTKAGVFNITSGYQISGDDIRFGGPVAALGSISPGSIWMNDTLYFPSGTPITSESVISALPSNSANVFVSRGAVDYAATAANWMSRRR
jgi:hypothetical protein